MSKNNTKEMVENLISGILKNVGEDVSREGLVETPQRVLKMYEELLSGYSQNPKSIFKTFNNNGYKDLVTLTNIRFYSLCEHHMIPFFGRIHIGYLPNGRVLGLSKFARLTEMFSHRLQTQENLTNQIADSLEDNLRPRGLIVNIEAEHLCMSMRGVKKTDCVTKTSTIRGLLKNKSHFVEQFYRDINSVSNNSNKI